MALDMSLVRYYFALFADLPEEEAARWDFTCRGAASRLEGRLRDDADVAGNREALCVAAAGLAWCDYRVLTAGAGGGAEFKLGDMTVKDSGTASFLEDLDEMREYFLGKVAPLIVGDVGVFLAVDSSPQREA